jgi:hypothetical protein
MNGNKEKAIIREYTDSKGRMQYCYGMTPYEIIDQLKLCSPPANQTNIAQSLNPSVKQPSVNQVIWRRQTSRRIQDEICDLLKKSRMEVWGLD